MIDLHCHILPGIDDGPADIEESLAMARYAVKNGISAIVATPHALGSGFDNPPEKIHQAMFDLQKRLDKDKIPLTLHPGAEVHLCPDMARRIMAEETLFLNQNRGFILVEFPFQSVPIGFKEELFQLAVHGITPVIAHPERNPMIGHDPGFLVELMDMGCLVQVNSTSITGGFGDGIMAAAHRLIEKRLVHVIASDAHSFDHRPPALSLAVEIAQGILKNADEAWDMVDATPKRIIAGL
jgi:protein-tyrosine phosphatase